MKRLTLPAVAVTALAIAPVLLPAQADAAQAGE